VASCALACLTESTTKSVKWLTDHDCLIDSMFPLTMNQTTEKHSPFLRVGGWVAELVLVFVGVYAAFWLNNYQQHRQDAERRDQILASLEQTLREGIESGKTATAREERDAAEFRRALDAGEMPPLQPFVFTTDYS